jgi:SAM-dependent methyltransferase
MTGKGTQFNQSARGVFEYGKRVNFGKTVGDYGRWRAGYPEQLYRRLLGFGIGLSGQKILDLATGTGFLGRGFARQGSAVTGLDISVPLMLDARRLDGEEGLAMTYLKGKAETLPFREEAFEVVSAGQSWHWFERAAAAHEALRVLRREGSIVIAHFDWLPMPGNVVEATEQLIRQHNPRWMLGGGLGIHPASARDVGIAGFTDIETFSFDVDVPYSHEGWRGRIRASAGVGGQLAPAQVAEFDADHATLLEQRFPSDPLNVPHRTFALIARSA